MQLSKQWNIGLLAIITTVAIFAWIWQKPSTVITKSWENLSAAETVDFLSQVSISNNQATQEILGESAAIEVNLDGVLQKLSDKPDALSTDVELLARTESVTVSIEGEVRIIDDRIYFNITSAPQAFPALTALKGQWLTLDRNPSPEQTTNKVILTSELFSEINRKNNQITAQASPEAIIFLLDSLANILGNNLSNEQIDNLRTTTQAAETLPITFTATPWSHQLEAMSLSLAVPGGNTMDFTLGIQDINKEVNITPPESHQPLQDFLAS